MEVEDFYNEWISNKPKLKNEFYQANIEAMAFAKAYHEHKVKLLTKKSK